MPKCWKTVIKILFDYHSFEEYNQADLLPKFPTNKKNFLCFFKEEKRKKKIKF